MIKIYGTASCPKTQLLKHDFDVAGIEYLSVSAVERIKERGITTIPQVEGDDGELRDYTAAKRYYGV